MFDTLKTISRILTKINNNLPSKILNKNEVLDQKEYISKLCDLQAKINQISYKLSKIKYAKYIDELLSVLCFEFRAYKFILDNIKNNIKLILLNYDYAINSYQYQQKYPTQLNKLTNLRKTQKDKIFEQISEIIFIEQIGKNIIIGHKHGIVFLDYYLEVIKNICFGTEIEIQLLFKKFSYDEILLYCPKNPLMIHVNLITFDYQFIYLPKNILDELLSQIYFWSNNYILLANHKQTQIFKISFISNQFEVIQIDDIKQELPLFYDFFKKSNKYIVYENNICISNIISASANKFQFVFKNYINEIALFDFVSNKIFPGFKYNGHLCNVIHSYSGCFAYIQKKEVSIYENTELKATLELLDDRHILGVCLLGNINDEILVLTNDISNNKVLLEVYEIKQG